VKPKIRSYLLIGGFGGSILLAGIIFLLNFGLNNKIIHNAVKVESKIPALIESTKRDLVFGLTQSTGVKKTEDIMPKTAVPDQTVMDLTMVAPTVKTAGPLKVNPQNQRYFMDKNGNTVYLTGSHTWANLQDTGSGYPPPTFDYPAYLDFLISNNLNFFRLWTWEQTRWSLDTVNNNYWFDPMPFLRPGPGNALDGRPKFDLTKLNQAYFDRMRSRIIQAGDRGIYVSVMLFDGWSVANDKGGYHKNNPWKGHPFNAQNNVNGINGDPKGHNDGLNTQDLSVPAITQIQEAYVQKVIDTVSDLDNVLYEIDNEGDGSSYAWQVHMVNFIKSYEAAKPQRHPVGMTALYPGGWDPDLFASPSDWISPNNDFDYLTNPPAADGSKVIVTDTDHLCGICVDHTWIWKSFTRGLNVLYMDGYDIVGAEMAGPTFNLNDPELPLMRKNMGYTMAYARRMNLAATTPRADLCSTSYCLANPSNDAAEFLVYAPKGGMIQVNLFGITGILQVEWLNPANGKITTGNPTSGGGTQSFTPPFSGDAVLFIHKISGSQVFPYHNYLPVVKSTAQAMAMVSNTMAMIQSNESLWRVSEQIQAAVSSFFIQLPIIINSNTPAPTAKDFLETFSGMPDTPTTFQSLDWDVMVHSRNASSIDSLTAMNADHGAQCQPPPATHVVDTFGNSVFICHDHVMTAIFDPDYGVIYLTPDRLVDFSVGETIISFDVSTLRKSTRDWIDLWITPFKENLQLPLEDWLPDLNGPPRHAIHIKMDSYNGATPFIGEVFNNFVSTALPRNSFTGYEGVLTPSPTLRDKFELHISRTHIKFGMPDYNLWWVDTDVQAFDWSEGVVQLGHHSYNPEKDCNLDGTCGANTWHWDNVYFSNAVPFTFVHPDKRFVDVATGTAVNFSAPAPANAFLRFAGIGSELSVSFDSGSTWTPCVRQPQMKSIEEHYSSYFTPIPVGVTQIMLRGSDWWGGTWNVRDISIWSLAK
jgi:hypothetical protein